MNLPNSNNFTEKECACQCGCGQMIIDEFLLNCSEQARIKADVAFPITSWNRCIEHNKNIGGSPTSDHREGEAIDIFCPDSTTRFIMIIALLEAGFICIGINIEKQFIHASLNGPSRIFIY